jgi:hypothetical protein
MKCCEYGPWFLVFLLKSLSPLKASHNEDRTIGLCIWCCDDRPIVNSPNDNWSNRYSNTVSVRAAEMNSLGLNKALLQKCQVLVGYNLTMESSLKGQDQYSRPPCIN